MKRTAGIILLLLFTCTYQIYSQDTGSEDGSASLPRGFRSILLGMTLEEAKQALLEEPYFNYRGDPDVSLLAEPNKTVIETDGAVYIKRGFFQFHEDALYIINLFLDRDEIDHYSLFTTLQKKYGAPLSLSPEAVIWEDGTVRLSLERPLTVKYIEKGVFQGLLENSKIRKSHITLSREEFLDQF